jgi:hypothetical protein
MPYLVYNVFTDDGVILYRLLGMGSSVQNSMGLGQQDLNKRSANEAKEYMTLHGHSFQTKKLKMMNESLMLSRKEVEARWGSDNRDNLFGYVIEKMVPNVPVKDKAYKLAWV